MYFSPNLPIFDPIYRSGIILNVIFRYFFAAVRAAGYRKPPRCGFIRWRAGGKRRAGFLRQAELLLCLHVACVVRVDWLQGPAASRACGCW